MQWISLGERQSLCLRGVFMLSMGFSTFVHRAYITQQIRTGHLQRRARCSELHQAICA